MMKRQRHTQSSTGVVRAIGRLVLGRREPLPDFLCIGAQKAGTTTLYQHMRSHPGIYMPATKEVHYFSQHFDRPLSWYESHFVRARRWQRTGEATPYYLFHPEAPGRIASVRPQARMIVLLRDPVERALSGYFHARRLGEETLDIEAAFDAEPERLKDAAATLAVPGSAHRSHHMHSYLSRSRYEEQLSRFLAHFPRSQLLLIRSEDLFASPAVIWSHVQAFLGVAPVPLRDPKIRCNQGAGEASAVSAAFRAELRSRLRATYHAMRYDFGMSWPESSDEGTGNAA